MLTHESIHQIRRMRDHARNGTGVYGMCHEVSEFIEGVFGWERINGTYCAPNGDVICYGHFWNILSDGSILDATADQFGEGHDIRVIPPSDPEFTRYRVEWYSEYNPDDASYSPDHPRQWWVGELDSEAVVRLEKERGRFWWVTDKVAHQEYLARYAVW